MSAYIFGSFLILLALAVPTLIVSVYVLSEQFLIIKNGNQSLTTSRWIWNNFRIVRKIDWTSVMDKQDKIISATTVMSTTFIATIAILTYQADYRITILAFTTLLMLAVHNLSTRFLIIKDGGQSINLAHWIWNNFRMVRKIDWTYAADKKSKISMAAVITVTFILLSISSLTHQKDGKIVIKDIAATISSANNINNKIN